MSDNIVLILTILFSAIIGGYIGMLFTKLKSKSEKSTLVERQNQMRLTIEDLKQSLNKIENEREDIRKEKEFLNTELVKKTSEYENLQNQNLKRDKELEERQEQLRKDFELLANKILEEKSNKFTEQNKENIKNILNPLQEKIQGFEKKVEETQFKSVKMHSALEEQLKGLKDLNQQMTKEANNLTRALKGDSKMQGNWGELVLERVLEKSGLEKDREYFVQQSFTRDDNSRVMPDVVLHLPDGKKMIIDSKVSLTDYERMVNADEDDRPQFLKAHVNSVSKHVEQLSSKNYQDLYDIESPDFVLMFIPIEPAFAVVVNEDNSIYNKAFEKNIVIVTPSTLLATLRTIDTMWNNEKQQRNAIEIAKQAGALYDQFVNLTDDLLKVGNQLNTAKGSYDSTMKKLTGRGNLLTKVENLKKLGIKANKQVNEKLLNKANENE
ncbi:DNA recombination protein RmuC [Seonamhaeicola aphaedonensis]|uniref:DNA recombination protein RmuC n=1 Tax=Seonamhaeicola aphaedonensis TaxID=1461338 RepID=A0A3D9H8X5_9FLAO|nr:DNA recombination protein RmuC [Seonamhaeicola aphaedonensis]RED45929.1 DNA recombination protein RmuC [Seonamhaeicola aphaedonensis]